ncbi:MAG: undecaprenyl/decaprenyl-phosphate alpha-N-acetylglucosaminyl 1-phosphate transferase [Anaerolineales bacterium]|nr:undecaprenyl/decaprenyl-phosphate alpha-N-acetylglucosaminyl 1-phosphate transferase [Anaerolineales bacterium]
MILQYVVPLFGATAITLLLAPLSIKIAIHFKLIDIPHSAPHKTHKNPVPKAGGIAIMFAVFLITVGGGKLFTGDIFPILLASIPIFLFGIWDDAKGLSAGWKLLGQCIASAILIWQGIYIRMLPHPSLNIALTFFWLIGMTNAFNLVDSMDGLVVGLTAIAGAFFVLVTVDANQSDLTYLSATLLGSCVGMFFFNSVPAKAFLGDSGAQFLGFVLASVALAYTPPGLPQPSSWFVPILLLSIPIFDTTLVVYSRLRQKVPIYKAGHDHIYHRLIELNMSPTQAVTAMHVSAILVGCLAFIALPLHPVWANTIFISAIFGGCFVILWLENNTRKR